MRKREIMVQEQDEKKVDIVYKLRHFLTGKLMVCKMWNNVEFIPMLNLTTGNADDPATNITFSSLSADEATY